MALPPEHISIKRRRQEEPVETLYLQNDGHQNKRRFTDFVFQRVQEGVGHAIVPVPKETPREPNRAVSRVSASGVPLVRATSPGAEFRNEQRRISARAGGGSNTSQENRANAFSTQSGTSAQDPLQNKSPETPAASPLSHQRRFHLTRSLGLPPSSKIPSGIRKHAPAGSRQNIATFVEVYDSLTGRQTSPKVNQVVTDLQDQKGERSAANQAVDTSLYSTASRKRPRASVAEKRWRAQQKHVPAFHTSHDTDKKRTGESVQDHPSRWNHNSDQLALELEQVALEVMAEGPTTRNENGPSGLPSHEEHIDQPPSHIDDGDDMEYVFDTYIRQPVKPLRRPQGVQEYTTEGVSNAPDGAYGVLIINEEDQELWEAYAEVEEPEWDEEDADSNAEDNPANDYPEEEIDSDDEHDYDPYRYRHDASDDEEFDMNDTAWSDED